MVERVRLINASLWENKHLSTIQQRTQKRVYTIFSTFQHTCQNFLC
jgi:hypothetical protein